MMPVPESLMLIACVVTGMVVYLLAAWLGRDRDGDEYLE